MVCRQIADAFRGDGLADYTNVDGVMPITHKTGCGMASAGEGIDLLRRVITGYIRHPKFAAVVVIGLGREFNQISSGSEERRVGKEAVSKDRTRVTTT